MSKKVFFGTDGIRGYVNNFPITSDFFLQLGYALSFFLKNKKRKKVLIGNDTRESAHMIESALTSGLLSMGVDCEILGSVPTPVVSYMTKLLSADAGIMISASHNPFYDNGIKFFGPDGFKLSDLDESKIETLYREDPPLVSSPDIGRASRITDGLGRYIEVVKTSLPPSFTLDGLKIVIDCANGASYKAAPEVLWELGAEVIEIGNKPNGFNINLQCGSMHTAKAIIT